MKKAIIAMFAFCSMLILVSTQGFASQQYKYHSPEQITQVLNKIAKENKAIAKVYNLAKTPGGRNVSLLQIGSGNGDEPAILVVANMGANYPISSEAALTLCRKLVSDWKNQLESKTWYVIPCGNPDGYAHFFGKPLYNNFGNDKPVNNDNDDAVDEDGPNDLNGDGYITMMRQKHPEGEWIPVKDNPLLMKKAERDKGEVGIYRLFQEGIDSDGDGDINEDGPGGVNPSHNFPHAFRPYTKTDGLWAASEAESKSIMRFAFDHPEIAMVIVLGRTNTLQEVPGGKKSKAMKDKYKLPRWMAGELGVDPNHEFPLSELVEMGREFTGNPNLDEDMILQFLDAGAAVNPNRRDIPYWTEITEKYKDFLKENDLDGKRLSSPGFPPGSIGEWAYYQYGVPTFCMDFWTLPEPEGKKDTSNEDSLTLTPDKLEKMSNDEFLALGMDKISAFLKENGAPAQYTADMVISGIKAGMMDTKRMAKMMRKMKKKEDSGGADETEEALYALNPNAFVPWKEYKHPTLGTVEIGGMIPYSTVLPPADKVDELIEKQIPFVLKLSDLLPKVSIDKVEVEKKSTGVYKITSWIKNNGFLPYPTYQGKRCQRPTPIVATLGDKKSLTVLEGRNRVVLGLIPGSGGYEKIEWLVEGKAGQKIPLTVEARSIGKEVKTISLKGGVQ